MGDSSNITTKSFHEIFDKSNVQYKIPFFQRGYVWGDKQQKQLYNDIKDHLGEIKDDNFAENRYFFGPVVVKQHKTENLKIQYQIIDGQQRFTTVYALIALIIKLLKGKDNGDDPNVSSYKDELSPFKENEASDKSDLDRLKILSSKADSPALYNVVFNGKPDKLSNAQEHLRDNVNMENNQITTMVKFWEKKFRRVDAKDLYVWAKTLLYSFEVVWIELREEQDEQVIFESLNDKGTPLTGGELICNYLFTPFKNDDTHEDLHVKKWLIPPT